jgi:two-component system, NtrC family, sensor kinase
MAAVPAKKYFSFQAKVLIPVVILLALFLSVIVSIVNRRLTDEFEAEAQQTLASAEIVFRNSFDIRTRNQMLRYQDVVNEPRFKAVAQLAEPKTMTVQLSELLNETGPEAEVMIFTTEKNVLLAGAERSTELQFQKIQSQSSRCIGQAQEGHAATDTIAVNDHLLKVISVPVVVNNFPTGILTIGVKIAQTAANELKLLTRTEIAFIASNTVAASTLQDVKLYPQLGQMFTRLKTSSAQKNIPHTMEIVSSKGEHFLCLAGTFAGSANNVGYLLLSSYEKALLKKEQTQQMITLLSLAGILLSSLLIWVLIRKITHPLRELRNSAEAVGRGDFSRRVEVQSQDECGELASVFNQMMENLKESQAEVHQTMTTLKNTQAQLIQTEKLSAIGEFVAGVAHELNNPLTGVIGFSHMLQESGISERQQGFVNRIIGSAERCHKIVQSLLSFSRRHRPERKWVTINSLMEGVLEILKYELASGNIEVITELSPLIPALPVDPHQIQQVFLNILQNARQAIDNQQAKGRIRISTELAGDKVRITVQDNGIGISEEHLKDIFNPFFTTKPVGEGTGLGLSLSYGIIHEHGGSIRVQSHEGEGATFTIELPVISKAPEAGTQKHSDAATSTTTQSTLRKKVLVIDDEEVILELTREALASRGYHVDIAFDGETAIRHLEEDHYDVIVCDWKIPGMGGQRIYERVREINPEAVRHFVFITGDVLSQGTDQFLRKEGKMCLLKPFSVDQLRQTIDQLLSSEK